jgi:hypothetical protein
MKKSDELMRGRTDGEEDLFDLSLDDLEPEDTIVESHVDEADEEIIELIDLVEKGDIDLGEEGEGPSELLATIQEIEEDTGDDLKVDETLDLLNIPLDQDLELYQIDGLKEEDKGIDAFEITDSDLFTEHEPEQPAGTTEAADALFDDIADESALKELIADETETSKSGTEIEGFMDAGVGELESVSLVHEEDKTIKDYEEATEAPAPVMGLNPEETEQPAALTLPEETVEERPAVQQDSAPVKEEPQPVPPHEAIVTGLSEEKIEAIIRKAVEDVVERVARETMTSVAEKMIGDAIETLKKSIESASD